MAKRKLITLGQYLAGMEMINIVESATIKETPEEFAMKVDIIKKVCTGQKLTDEEHEFLASPRITITQEKSDNGRWVLKKNYHKDRSELVKLLEACA